MPKRHSVRPILFLISFALYSSAPAMGWGQSAGRVGSGTPQTVGRTYSMQSNVLNERREYSVALPEGYAGSKGVYPLVVVLDGEYYFQLAATACSFMSMNQLMPQPVVVGINNTQRRRDMTPPDISLEDVVHGGGDKFLGFLETELLPRLQREYRLLPLRVLVGHSHGGLIGAYAVSARPDLFRWYLLIDPPMQLGGGVSEKRLESFFAATGRGRTGKLISIEHSFGWSDSGWSRLARAVPQSYQIRRMRNEDDTHPAMFYKGLYDGLRWLFGDLMARDTLATLDRLKRRYDAFSAAYGYTVPIPRSSLDEAAEDQLMAGFSEEALKIVDAIVAGFGADAATGGMRAWIDTLRAEPLKETFDRILASPMPDTSAIRPFLGTWEMTAHTYTPNRLVISFGSDGGRVSAVQHEYDESGAEVSPTLGDIAFLRMAGRDTLEWGYRNGMRPKTMLIALTVVRRDSVTLEGISHPIGVSFSPEREDHPGKGREVRFVKR